MAGSVIVEVVHGPLMGQVFPFSKHDTLIVGRSDSCHIALPGDPFLSRHHFSIEVIPPMARLRDLGSLNGTYVDGTRYGGRTQGDQHEAIPQAKVLEVDLHHGYQLCERVVQ